jgi:hypothetical protein
MCNIDNIVYRAADGRPGKRLEKVWRSAQQLRALWLHYLIARFFFGALAAPFANGSDIRE